MKIGVLALQGDFEAHRRRLQELGAEVVLVRKPDQLDQIDGLVIPGGESSTFLKLLGEKGFQKLNDFVHNKPTFGTCAGAILLAKQVKDPDQPGLNAIDITVQRNAYGRQIDSTILSAMTALGGDPLEMVFIRAPRIESDWRRRGSAGQARRLSCPGSQGKRDGGDVSSRAFRRYAGACRILETGAKRTKCTKRQSIIRSKPCPFTNTLRS